MKNLVQSLFKILSYSTFIKILSKFIKKITFFPFTFSKYSTCKMSTADANEITEMKKKLNIELACEQTYTPSAPPLYPSLPVLKDLPKKPKKPINQTNNFWGKLFLYVFAAWVIIGVLGKNYVNHKLQLYFI